MSISVSPATVQKLEHPLFDKMGVEVMIKREDLLHAEVSGNKWRKLKYNLAFAKENGFKRLLTFGGAYSNHLYATAAAGKYFGFDSIGVVRGEPIFPLNPTLNFAVKCGMQLHYVGREEYRQKESNRLTERLKEQYGDVYIIPEGGSNVLGVSGCMDILTEVKQAFDIVAAACGTGATLAGLVLSLEKHQKAIGFSALKGGDFLKDEVMIHVQSVLNDPDLSPDFLESFEIETAYHFGGYSKVKPELIIFMQMFYQLYGIKLDPVYTGKMVYGIFKKIENGDFIKGTKILLIHTGGLQGLAGFQERLGVSVYPNC